METSTDEWVTRLACSESPVVSTLPNEADDGTLTETTLWTGCDGDVHVLLVKIEGGGHTWPGGDQYFPVRLVGPVTRDWNSTLIWEFLSQFDR